jgi:hypothetical protein
MAKEAVEVKKTPKSSNTERNKKARAARVAKAIKKGRKANRTVAPELCSPPGNWGLKRKPARQMSRYQKALQAFTTLPPCCLKNRTMPDCPEISATAELRQTMRAASKANPIPETTATAE